MITVLIEMRDDRAGALQATLACLVPGAVEGLVRTVVVFDQSMGPNARMVADDAGCVLRGPHEIGDALGPGSGEWFLLLEAGATLSQGWVDIVGAHLRSASAARRAVRFSCTLADRWGVPVLPRGRRLGRGVLAPRKSLADRYRTEMRLGDLAATISTGVLDARIVPPRRMREG